MPLGVLAQGYPGIESHEGDELVVINADSTGIAGIHGRRPVVSITELAQEWLAPTSPIKGAEQIVLHQGEPIEAFEWFKVDTTVRSLTKDGRLSIQTIKPVYS